MEELARSSAEVNMGNLGHPQRPSQLGLSLLRKPGSFLGSAKVSTAPGLSPTHTQAPLGPV